MAKALNGMATSIETLKGLPSKVVKMEETFSTKIDSNSTILKQILNTTNSIALKEKKTQQEMDKKVAKEVAEVKTIRAEMEKVVVRCREETNKLKSQLQNLKSQTTTQAAELALAKQTITTKDNAVTSLQDELHTLRTELTNKDMQHEEALTIQKTKARDRVIKIQEKLDTALLTMNMTTQSSQSKRSPDGNNNMETSTHSGPATVSQDLMDPFTPIKSQEVKLLLPESPSPREEARDPDSTDESEDEDACITIVASDNEFDDTQEPRVITILKEKKPTAKRPQTPQKQPQSPSSQTPRKRSRSPSSQTTRKRSRSPSSKPHGKGRGHPAPKTTPPVIRDETCRSRRL